MVDALLRTGDGDLHSKAIAAVERILFAKVLEHTRGNQGKACELLGLNRSTLRHRLRQLGLTIDKIAVDRGPGTPHDKPAIGKLILRIDIADFCSRAPISRHHFVATRDARVAIFVAGIGLAILLGSRHALC